MNQRWINIVAVLEKRQKTNTHRRPRRNITCSVCGKGKISALVDSGEREETCLSLGEDPTRMVSGSQTRRLGPRLSRWGLARGLTLLSGAGPEPEVFLTSSQAMLKLLVCKPSLSSKDLAFPSQASVFSSVEFESSFEHLFFVALLRVRIVP